MKKSKGRYTLLKIISISLSVFSGFYQPFVYDRNLSEGNFSFLIVLFGIATYLIFFDAGLSKPLYSHIRKKFITNKSIDELILFTNYAYSILFVVISVVFSTVVLLFSIYSKNSFTLTVLLIYCLSTAVNIIISYYKNILYAIDHYFLFDSLDILRKCISIISVSLLFIDSTYFSTVLLNLIFSVFILTIILNKTRSSIFLFLNLFSINLILFKKIFKKIYGDSKNNLLFTINELFIYNYGFLIFPFFMNSFQLIIFGLFFRLFNGLSMIPKLITDVLIHELTQLYFSKSIKLKRKFKKAYFLTTLSFLFGISLLFIFDIYLFKFWVDKKYSFSLVVIISLSIYFLSNSIRNMSGTFLISIGDHFKILRNISYWETFLIIMSLILGLSISKIKIDFVLLLVSINSLYFSIVYLKKSVNLLWKN